MRLRVAIGVFLLFPAAVAAQQAKINLISATKAPEATLFATVLDGNLRPLPTRKISRLDVWMDGRRIEEDAEVISLRASEHGVAVALVVCGAASCRPVTKAMKKGFSAFADVARAQDRGVTVVYENNIVAYGDDGDQPLSTAVSAVSNARISATAYRSRYLAALDRALAWFEEHEKTLPPQRVVVLVSDGFDADAKSQARVEGKLAALVKHARALGVRAYVVGLGHHGRKGLPALRLLARKSGGTFRDARRVGDVAVLLKEVAAEVFGQLVVEIVPPLKKGRTHRFSATVDIGGRQVSTPRKPPYLLRADRLHFRWRFWGRIALIVLAVVLVLLLIVLIVRAVKRRKKRKAALKQAYGKMDAAEDADADDVLDVQEADGCGTCGRPQLPEWDHCMFCAAGIGDSGGS